MSCTTRRTRASRIVLSAALALGLHGRHRPDRRLAGVRRLERLHRRARTAWSAYRSPSTINAPNAVGPGRDDRAPARCGSPDAADDDRLERVRRGDVDPDRSRRVDHQRARHHREPRLDDGHGRGDADLHGAAGAERAPAGRQQQHPRRRRRADRHARPDRHGDAADRLERERAVDGPADRASSAARRRPPPSRGRRPPAARSPCRPPTTPPPAASSTSTSPISQPVIVDRRHDGLDALAHQPLRRHADRAPGGARRRHPRRQRRPSAWTARASAGRSRPATAWPASSGHRPSSRRPHDLRGLHRRHAELRRDLPVQRQRQPVRARAGRPVRRQHHGRPARPARRGRSPSRSP